MECRPPTGASVAQVPEPRPESVAKEPKPVCRPGTETPHVWESPGAGDGNRTRVLAWEALQSEIDVQVKKVVFLEGVEIGKIDYA